MVCARTDGFDFGDGHSQLQQVRIAEVINFAVPRQQWLVGGSDNRIPAFAFGKDLRGIVGPAFADVNGGRIRVLSEPQIQNGGLEAKSAQIGI